MCVGGGKTALLRGLGIMSRLDGQERDKWAVSGNLLCFMFMFDFHDFLRFWLVPVDYHKIRPTEKSS